MQYSLCFLSGILLATTSCNAVAVPEPLPFPMPATSDFKPPTPQWELGPDQGKRNYEVTVAQTSHEFRPNNLTRVEIGDTITFKFYPQTHSVVLADYQSPCVPWSLQHPGQDDVWSGMITETEHRPNPHTWTIRVTTQDSRFYYCSGPDSCKGWGMVFAVNPTDEQSWNDFYNRAKTADYQISPGENPPKEGGIDEKPKEDKDSGLSTGAIAGIAVGSVIAIALIGLLFFFVGRSRRKPTEEKAPPVTAAPAIVTTVPGFEQPPPGYEHRYSTPAPGWDTVKPSVTPAPLSPHLSTGFPSPNPGHTSWAPSELGGESAPQRVVEIYTPGVDERIPLNTGPNN